MPIFNVKAPDGSEYKIEAPEGTSQDSILQAAAEHHSAVLSSQKRPDYSFTGALKAGFGSGTKRLLSEFGDVIPAIGASALGFDEYAKRQMEEAAQSQREIAAEYPEAFESYKDVQGLGDFATFAAMETGKQIPNIATMIGPGAAGRVIGGRMAAKAAAEKIAGREAEEAVAKGAAERYAAQRVGAGKEFGQNLGVYLGAYSLNAPEVFGSIYNETGKLEPGAALIASSISSVLDSYLPSKLLNTITGPMKVGVVENILKQSGMKPGIARKAVSGLTEAATMEGLTEGAQEAINIAAEKFVQNNPQLFSSKDWERVTESAVRGAVTGGVFGGVGAVPARIRERGEEKRVSEGARLELDRQQQEQQNALNQLNSDFNAQLGIINQSSMTEDEKQQRAKELGDVFNTQTLDLLENQQKEREGLKRRGEVNDLLTTREGTQTVLDNLANYFSGYNQTEQNKIRIDLQRHQATFDIKDEDARTQKQKELEAVFANVPPTPLTELTSQRLKEVGIKSGKLFEMLKGKSLANQEVYNIVADIAGNDKNPFYNDHGTKALTLLESIGKEGNIKRQGELFDEGTVETGDREGAEVSGQPVRGGVPGGVEGGVGVGDTGAPVDVAAVEGGAEGQPDTLVVPQQLDMFGQPVQDTGQRILQQPLPIAQQKAAKTAKQAATTAAASITPPAQVTIPTTLGGTTTTTTKQPAGTPVAATTETTETDETTASEVEYVPQSDMVKTPNDPAQTEEQSEKLPLTMVSSNASVSLANSVGKVISSLPYYNTQIGQAASGILFNAPRWLRKTYLAFTSLPNKIELYGQQLPALQSLLDALEKRANVADSFRREVEALVINGKKIIDKFPEQVVKKFNKITFDLSVQNIDPRKDVNSTNQLVINFRTLPPELQKLAIDYTEQYEKYSQRMIDMIAKASPTTAKALRAQFEKNKLPFYHPLRRRGDYWLTYKDKDGERVVIASIDPKIREDMIKEAKAKGGTEFERYAKLEFINYKNAPPTGFMGQIVDLMRKGGVEDSIIDQAYRVYLDLMPAESLRQLQKEREGVPGYIEDVVAGFADVGSKMAHQLANLEYRPMIDQSIADLVAQGKNQEEPIVDVVNDVLKQRAFLENPVADTWSSRASYVSYTWNIAGNVSSALVNITQLPMMVYPMLGGEYGYLRAAEAMNRARAIYMKGGIDKNREFLPDYTFGMSKDLSKGHKLLYEEALKHSIIKRGVGYELTDMRKNDTADFSGIKGKVDTALGWVFQNSERMNREITLLAAYDLAIEKGDSHEAAVKKAMDLTTKVHSHALSEVGPRLFQTGWGKVAFTFKRFAQAQIYNIARLFYQSTKGMTKDERDTARKQLLGIYGMTFAVAGLQGLPLYGAVNMLASAIAAMGDDEPYDFDEEVRTAVGDLGYKGALNKLLAIDIASRTGFNGMIWRSDERRLSEVGMGPYIAEHFFGPAYQAVFINPTRAAELFSQGQSYRAVETMLPSFVKNPLKGFRFATEGALTANGVPLKEDFNAYESFSQILGFTNAELAETYARANSMKKAELKLTSKKTSLLDLLYLARMSNDVEGMAEVNEKINKFNEVVPGAFRITEDTKARSYRQHVQRGKDSIDGVYINKNVRDYIEENYGD
jgi:hypothetical protein